MDACYSEIQKLFVLGEKVLVFGSVAAGVPGNTSLACNSKDIEGLSDTGEGTKQHKSAATKQSRGGKCSTGNAVGNTVTSTCGAR